VKVPEHELDQREGWLTFFESSLEGVRSGSMSLPFRWLLCLLFPATVLAGDFESFYDHHFELRRDAKFERRELGAAQKRWKQQMAPTMRPRYSLDTFVPTTLSFLQNGQPVAGLKGQVFQGVEDPGLFLLPEIGIIVDFRKHRVCSVWNSAVSVEIPEKRTIALAAWETAGRVLCPDTKFDGDHVTWRWRDPSGASAKEKPKP